MRVWTRSFLRTSVVGVLAAVTVFSSAEPFAAEQSAAGTRVVVRAIANDGRPVLDLSPADITIRVDGRQREVKALELVRPPAASAAGAPASPAPPSAAAPGLPAPYATNAAAAAAGGGRQFLIAIDDEGIAPGRDSLVRQAVQKLVSSLSPADAIGVVAMRRGGRSLAPTTDRTISEAALGQIVAAGAAGESVVDFGCRTKAVITGLEALLREAPAERTILLFSSGVTPPTGDAIRQSLGRREDAEEAVCHVRQRELEELGKAAANSPASLVVVFVPEAVANPTHLKTGEAGLENIAGVTGGDMIRMIGDAAPAMGRLAETAGTYYVATLDGANDQASWRRVDARVNRDSVRITARPMAGAAAPGAAKAGTPRDMIRVATVYRDVAIRAAGFVSRQPGTPDLKVVALFEPEDPNVKLTAAMVGLFDEKGALKAQWTAQANELGRAPVVAALTAPPGNYRMRVAASDASGKGGTTDYDLSVQLPDAAPVKTSQMLLGVGQGGFAPKLAFTAADAAAIGFIEIYNVAKDAKLEATFEIVKPGGEVMGSGQGTIGAGPGDDARIAYGGFGIATLEPGDYTMRATITVDGKQAGIATRTLRKLE